MHVFKDEIVDVIKSSTKKKFNIDTGIAQRLQWFSSSISRYQEEKIIELNLKRGEQKERILNTQMTNLFLTESQKKYQDAYPSVLWNEFARFIRDKILGPEGEPSTSQVPTL